MKKYFILAFLFSLPLFSFLTITKAQETVDIEASRENLSSCVLISTNVSYKNRKNNNKDDVILLQDFLNSNGYLEADSVTGFFGKITEKAVARFQADNGLVARPEGYVGPGTRTKIQARSCGSSVSIINKTTTEPAVIYFTDADKNQGWYYGDIAQMKKGTPTDWVLVNAGTRSAMWKAPVTSVNTSTTVDPTIIYFTEADKNQGWYYGDIAQMKKGTPTDWVLISAGTKSAMWKAPVTSVNTSTTVDPTIIYFTEVDKNQGWYYGDIAQMKKGTPTDWVLVNAGTRSARWEAPIKTETFLPSGCTATSLFSVTTGLTCQTNVR